MKFRTTEAPDTTAPVITLTGSPTITLAYGTTWTDPGATCVDNTDTACVVVTTGTVNTNVPGSYTITYTAKDSAGNRSTETRIVTVLPKINTPLQIGSIMCGATTVTIGNTTTCSITPIEPDGISAVSAQFD